MATSEQITVAEDIYRGGTIVAPRGSTLTPEMAHTLGVSGDGTPDLTLSTDDLLARAARTGLGTGGSAAATVPADVAVDSLADANADEVVAFLEANPAEVDRVAAMEQGRAKPRVTVMDAVERIRSGG